MTMTTQKKYQLMTMTTQKTSTHDYDNTKHINS